MPDPTPTPRDRELAQQIMEASAAPERLAPNQYFPLRDRIAEALALRAREGRKEALRWRRRGDPKPRINTRKNDRPLAVVKDEDGWIGVASIQADGRWLRRGKRAKYAPAFFLPVPDPPAPSGAEE